MGLLERRAALWCVGHFASTNEGLEIILDHDDAIVEKLLDAASGDPCYSMRGTCLHVLSLIGITSTGRELIRACGWGLADFAGDGTQIDSENSLVSESVDDEKRASSYREATASTIVIPIESSEMFGPLVVDWRASERITGSSTLLDDAVRNVAARDIVNVDDSFLVVVVARLSQERRRCTWQPHQPHFAEGVPQHAGKAFKVAAQPQRVC